MFLGLRTVIYPVADIEKGKVWYTTILGQEPYFDQPFYVGYNVAGYEVGLVPNAGAHSSGGAGPVAYLGVANIEESMARVIVLGAVEREAIQDVGDGIKVATVADPYGNSIGIIENPHFSLPDAR